MELSALIQIINSGIPAGIVTRLASEAILKLIEKVKAKFNGKAVTEEKLKQLMDENVELKETVVELQNGLAKENIFINNDGKIEKGNMKIYNFGKIKKQINAHRIGKIEM